MSIDEAATQRRKLKVHQAAELLSVHPQLIYLAVNRGQLKAKRIPGRDPSLPGKAIRIDVEDLQAWFDSLDDAQDTA